MTFLGDVGSDGVAETRSDEPKDDQDPSTQACTRKSYDLPFDRPVAV